jgi:hypothetical protein
MYQGQKRKKRKNNIGVRRIKLILFSSSFLIVEWKEEAVGKNE